MNSKERLLAGLHHEEPDCVPNNPRLFAWMLDYFGNCDYRTVLSAAEQFDFDPVLQTSLDVPNVLYSQIHAYQAFPDIRVELSIRQEDGVTRCRRAIFTPAGKLEDEMIYPPPGGIYGISPNPERLEYMIKDRSDIEKVRYLLPDPITCSPAFPPMFDKDVRDNSLIELRAHSGADHLLVDSLGLTNAMVAYYDDRDMLFELVDLYARYYRRCIERALEFEPDILFDSWYNCSMSAGWSPSLWKELFYPHIKANRELVRAAGVFYHFYDDGKIMQILPLLQDLAPDILSTLCPPPAGDVNLREVKRVLGEKTCLNGYVDLQTLLRGTPEQVEQEVREAIHTAAPGGGYWLGTSDSIRNGSPLENVEAYFRAARKCGRYPIR